MAGGGGRHGKGEDPVSQAVSHPLSGEQFCAGDDGDEKGVELKCVGIITEHSPQPNSTEKEGVGCKSWGPCAQSLGTHTHIICKCGPECGM